MSTRELPEFLKRGWPEGPPPRAYPRPGRMSFPELRPVAEPGLHDAANMGEWVVRDWVRLVDARRIGES